MTEKKPPETYLGTDFHDLPRPSSKPEDERALSRIIENHTRDFYAAVSPQITRMWVYNLLVRGIRHFTAIDFDTGRISWSERSESGEEEYVHQELVTKKEQAVRRMMAFDTAPSATARNNGLEPRRHAAVAQAIADAMVNPFSIHDTKRTYYDMLAGFGGAGLYGTTANHSVMGISGDIQVVPPWEIFFWPKWSMDPSKQRGIGWRRYVPLRYLRQKFGNAKINARIEDGRAHNKLRVHRIPWGHHLAQSHFADPERGPYTSTGGASDSSEAVPGHQEVVELVELWLQGPNGTVSRYIVKSGDAILTDLDLSGDVAYCPLAYGRYADNGTPYGIGVVGLLSPLLRQVEKMGNHLFDFVQQLDRFGFLALANGTYNLDNLVDTGKGLRLLMYEQESFGRTNNPSPVQIQPHNPGPFAGNVMATGIQMADRIAPDPAIEHGEAPGRTDSASAMMFLAEQSANNIALPASEVNRVFGNAYRNIVFEAVRQLRRPTDSGERPTVPLINTGIEMLGVVVSGESDERVGFLPSEDSSNSVFYGDAGGLRLSLSANPLPDMTSIDFGIRSMTPRSKSARKQEVLQAWTSGMIEGAAQGGGHQELVLLSVREGLDLPIDQTIRKETIRRVQLAILVLFNDGKTPGPVVDNMDTGDRELTLHLIEEVMATAEFAFASPDVQDAFLQWKANVQSEVTATIQGVTPSPTEAAREAILRQQQQGAIQ